MKIFLEAVKTIQQLKIFAKFRNSGRNSSKSAHYITVELHDHSELFIYLFHIYFYHNKLRSIKN